MHYKRKTTQSILVNLLRVKVPLRLENNTTLKVTPMRINIKCTGLAVHKGNPYQVVVYEHVVEDIVYEELEGRKNRTDDLRKGVKAGNVD